MKKQRNSPNSFYRFGGIEILSLAQDERSKLWKIYFSTPDHYLVSREFDRSVGLYANAPDDVIRQGLMDFSDSLMGSQLSLFKVMDMFIDRCFDENVFYGEVENAVWMCIDYPTYDEVEEIINTYNCRIKWFDGDDSSISDCLKQVLYRMPDGEQRKELIRNLKEEFQAHKITSVFMNRDSMVEKFITDREFTDMPIFMGEFSDDGEFISFNYLRH